MDDACAAAARHGFDVMKCFDDADDAAAASWAAAEKRSTAAARGYEAPESAGSMVVRVKASRKIFTSERVTACHGVNATLTLCHFLDNGDAPTLRRAARETTHPIRLPLDAREEGTQVRGRRRGSSYRGGGEARGYVPRRARGVRRPALPQRLPRPPRGRCDLRGNLPYPR